MGLGQPCLHPCHIRRVDERRGTYDTPTGTSWDVVVERPSAWTGGTRTEEDTCFDLG